MKKYKPLKENAYPYPFDVDEALVKLENFLDKLTKTSIVLRHGKKNTSSGPVPIFESQMILNKAGVFNLVLDELRVTSFNSEINKEKGFWWVTIDLSYKSKSGGSNGMQIGTAWYNFSNPDDQHWMFQTMDNPRPSRIV